MLELLWSVGPPLYIVVVTLAGVAAVRNLVEEQIG